MASKVLAKGTVVRLTNGKTATVTCKLGEGGPGTVYKVLIEGNEYALKWYHPKIFSDCRAYP